MSWHSLLESGNIKAEAECGIVGLHCQGLFLQYGKGNVCLLQRSKRCDVPKNVSPLTSLIAVLVAVWQMRVSCILPLHPPKYYGLISSDRKL